MQPPDLRWSFDGTTVAYSTVTDGDMRNAAARTAFLVRCGAPRLVCGAQVHGTCIVRAEAPAQAPLAGVDGLVSDRRGLALGVFGADCPGLVLDAGDALGVAHCGWRGAAAGIVGHLVEELAELSDRPPERWRAFCGPGIAGEHYEVDAPVLQARAWPEEALRPSRPDHARLDLTTVLRLDCAEHGITDWTASGLCTAADPRLHSYRDQGRGSQQLLVAWRT